MGDVCSKCGAFAEGLATSADAVFSELLNHKAVGKIVLALVP